MHANNPKDALQRDLFAIYENAGREVTYVTDRGEERPYWANRFRQALQRAVNEDALVEFVERLMTAPEPSRGFFYLKDAGRLDLSVEALVADGSRSYHSMFSAEAVNAARTRLAAHPGQQTPPIPTTPTPAGSVTPPASGSVSTPTLAPGSSFDIRVTVGAGGELTLALI